MPPASTNPFPRLIELDGRLTATDQPDAHELRLNLNVGSTDIDGYDGLLGVSNLRLVVIAEGSTVDKDRLFGEVRPEKISDLDRTERTVTRSWEASAEVGVKANSLSNLPVPPGEVEGRVGGKVSSITEEKSIVPEKKYHPVRYRGGNTWDVSSENKKIALDMKALSADENVLCKVVTNPGANSMQVIVYVEVRQRDLIYPSHRSLFSAIQSRVNAPAIMNILIAKSLHGQLPGYGKERYEGRAALSLLVLSDEDNAS